MEKLDSDSASGEAAGSPAAWRELRARKYAAIDRMLVRVATPIHLGPNEPPPCVTLPANWPASERLPYGTVWGDEA